MIALVHDISKPRMPGILRKALCPGDKYTLPCTNESAVLEHTLMMLSETSHVPVNTLRIIHVYTVTAKGLLCDCFTFMKVGVTGYVTCAQ